MLSLLRALAHPGLVVAHSQLAAAPAAGDHVVEHQLARRRTKGHWGMHLSRVYLAGQHPWLPPRAWRRCGTARDRP